LEEKSVQLVRTSWYNVSKYFLNRGYRIIIALPNQQSRILAQEKNDIEGKKRIESRWKQIVQAIQEAHVVQEKPNKCIKENGYFQASTVVVESAEAYDYNLPHFQNVYYGSLDPTDSPENTLHSGMAQCTIPPDQLKEMYSILSRNSFWLKLWPSPTVQSTININYLNEVDPDRFRDTLNEPIVNTANATHCRNLEILLYIPRSSKSFEDNLVQTSQLAIDIGFSGKVVVFDWCSNKNSSQVVDKAKPKLLKFLNMLCAQSNKVHIVAVNDAALLLVKSLAKFNHKLGQVVFTKLLSLSTCIFDELQSMVGRDLSLLSQAENITIYHRPKSCRKTLLRSFTVAGHHETFPKKTLLEPPPLIHKVDIICLGNLSCSQLKIRDYSMDKVIIEDMSELISLGKTIAYRSPRIQLQCGCTKLKAPIYRSHLPCTLCSRLSYFVMGRVLGLGNFTPMFLEEVSQSLLESRQKEDKIKKCSEIEAKLLGLKDDAANRLNKRRKG